MKAAAETTLAIAADPKRLGARIGITAVLHTWGSTLTHHPHVHMIVPGGGLSLDGARWVASRSNFLRAFASKRRDLVLLRRGASTMAQSAASFLSQAFVRGPSRTRQTLARSHETKRVFPPSSAFRRAPSETRLSSAHLRYKHSRKPPSNNDPGQSDRRRVLVEAHRMHPHRAADAPRLISFADAVPARCRRPREAPWRSPARA
jgi:hypothetical protein